MKGWQLGTRRGKKSNSLTKTLKKEKNMIDETGKVVFEDAEQAEVNRIVEERLARERSKYSDYEDLRGTIAELNALGYEGNAKEVKEAIRAAREESQRELELQALQEQEEIEGTSPALIKKMKDMEKELQSLKQEKENKIRAAEEKAKADEQTAIQINEFEDNFPDVDLQKLLTDEDFKEFMESSNPNLTVSQVYEKFSKYVHGAEKKAAAKIQSNLERSTSSGKQKGRNDTYGLTADQKAIVDDWNKSARNAKEKMTYEEFAASLRK